MKQATQLVLFCLAILTACQPAPNTPVTPENIDNQPATLPAAAPITASATLNNETITVSVPPGWDAITTENAILYTESRHSVEDVGHLDGIAVSVFSPSSGDYTHTPSASTQQITLRTRCWHWSQAATST